MVLQKMLLVGTVAFTAMSASAPRHVQTMHVYNYAHLPRAELAQIERGIEARYPIKFVAAGRRDRVWPIWVESPGQWRRWGPQAKAYHYYVFMDSQQPWPYGVVKAGDRAITAKRLTNVVVGMRRHPWNGDRLG